jgi:hypothetical protein
MFIILTLDFDLSDPAFLNADLFFSYKTVVRGNEAGSYSGF